MQSRFRKSDRLRRQSEFDRAWASPWFAADRTLVIQAVPNQLERTRLGAWVIVFLLVFGLFSYLLKEEIWKDIK